MAENIPITTEELKGLISEWDSIAKGHVNIPTPHLENAVEKTKNVESSHKFFTNIRNVTDSGCDIPGFLFAKYKSQESQPDLEQEWLSSKTYSYVRDEMDELLQMNEFPQYSIRPQSVEDLDMWRLIVWSLELWFTRRLHRCHHIPVKTWLRKEYGNKLFERYFDPLYKEVGRTCFELLAEKDCADFVENLLSPEMTVATALQEHLGTPENIKLLNTVPMTTEIMKIVNCSSKKYYIVPRPSKEEGKSRMYGIHAYGFLRKEQGGYGKDEKEAADAMLVGLKKAGFEVITPSPDSTIFNSGEETFDKLKEWMVGKLYDIRGHCSVLFFSMMCHGHAAHVTHKYEGGEKSTKIEEFLELLNHDVLELKDIPKVIAIEACQGCYKTPKETLQGMIDRYPDVMLLMSCAQGTDNWLCGYLVKLAKSIGNHSNQSTVQEMHDVASEDHIAEQKEAFAELGPAGDELVSEPIIHQRPDTRGLILPGVGGRETGSSDEG